MEQASGSPAWLPDRFRLRRRLGGGGMGEVWLADDRERGGPVALKRWRADPGDPGSAEALRLRLKREYFTLRGLTGEGIVRVHDLIDTPDALFYTMDYFAGEPPRRFLAARAGSARYWESDEGLARVWRLAEQLLTALAQLHARAILHRDLKPANLLVDESGRLRLIDFGLTLPRATEFGAAQDAPAGTLDYLAPELIRNEPSDARTDLYAAGAIFYELATGRRPFQGVRMSDLLAHHLHREPPPPRALNPRITRAHGDFIVRLLAKAPAARPSTALDALGALRACGGLRNSAHQDRPAADTPHELLAAPYVGNARAIRALRHEVSRLGPGVRRLLLVGGEAGSGKSYLRRELGALAAEAGVTVWEGRCWEAAGAPAQLFQSLLAGAGSLPPDAVSPELAAHFPALQRWLPAGTRPPDPLDPAAEKARVFDAMLRLFTAMTRRQPMILFLEDLHWADPLSLELIDHLHRGAARAAEPGGKIPGLQLIATHRDDPASLSGAPGRWLAAQRGAGAKAKGITAISLRPLTAADTARLMRALLGLRQAPAEPVVRRMLQLTGGNPYLLHETLRASRARGAAPGRALIPAGGGGRAAPARLARPGGRTAELLAALERRLLELPPKSVAALRVAALIGRESRWSWWRDASGLGDRALFAAAEPALRQRLLQERADGTLEFTHDLLRDALIRTQPPALRRRLHRRIHRVLAADPALAAERPQLLAHHARHAGLRRAALVAGLAAARLHHRTHELPEVEYWVEQCRALYPDVSGMPPRERLAWMYQRLILDRARGGTANVLALLPVAMRLARRQRNRLTEGRLENLYSGALRSMSEYRRALPHSRRAGAIHRGTGNLSEWLLARVTEAECHYRTGDFRRGRAMLKRSLRTAQARHEWRMAGAAANLLGHSYYLHGEYLQAGRHFRLAHGISVRHDAKDRLRAAIYLNNLGEASLEAGELPRAGRELHEAIGVHESLSASHNLTDALVTLARVKLAAGRVAEADRLLRRADLLAHRHRYREYRYYVLQRRAEISMLAGRRRSALGQLRRCVRGFAALGLPDDQLHVRQIAALLALRHGDAAAARRAAASARDTGPGAAPLRVTLSRILQDLAGGPVLQPATQRRLLAEMRRLAASGRVALALELRLLLARRLRREGRPARADALSRPALAQARRHGLLLLAGLYR